MTIDTLGQFGLIEKLTNKFAISNPTTVKGVGDDAAVIAAHMDETLISTDMLLEGIHFDLSYMPLRHLGYKAAIVGFSDIYAMNGYPRQLLVALGVSRRFSVEDLEELYEGIRIACAEHEVDLVGGDTGTSLTGLTLAITTVGECEPGKVAYRSGAQPTDLVCLSGNVGAACMGLFLLERERNVAAAGGTAFQLEGHEYLVERFMKPVAQRHLIDSLREADMQPTSMIDVSDGLASDMLQLCKQSNVGVRLYMAKIPIAKDTNDMATEMNLNPMTVALNGGEDYELLFTLPLRYHDRIKELPGVDIIGHIVDPAQGAYLVPPEGQEIALRAQGFGS